MAEKILTLHPDGKMGVNIDRKKYELVKGSILQVLGGGPKRYSELRDAVSDELKSLFEGSISWYVVTVKLDLEARGIITRNQDLGGHTVSLAK